MNPPNKLVNRHFDFLRSLLYELSRSKDPALRLFYQNLLIKGGVSLAFRGSPRSSRKDLDMTFFYKSPSVTTSLIDTWLDTVPDWNPAWDRKPIDPSKSSIKVEGISYQHPHSRPGQPGLGSVDLEFSRRKIPPRLQDKIKRVEIEDAFGNRFVVRVVALEETLAEKTIRLFRKDKELRMDDVFDVGYAVWLGADPVESKEVFQSILTESAEDRKAPKRTIEQIFANSRLQINTSTIRQLKELSFIKDSLTNAEVEHIIKLGRSTVASILK